MLGGSAFGGSSRRATELANVPRHARRRRLTRMRFHERKRLVERLRWARRMRTIVNARKLTVIAVVVGAIVVRRYLPSALVRVAATPVPEGA